jgi:hypothetical protein
MVRHWARLRSAGWRASAVINAVGAVVTAMVLVIVAMTKALEGAWIVLVMIPVLVGIFAATKRHYQFVASELTLRNWQPNPGGHHTVIVPIGGLQVAVMRALDYARSIATDVRAVYVETDPGKTVALREQWPLWADGMELVILPSPRRSVLEPLLAYIGETRAANPCGWVTVILPEFVPRHLWQHIFHNQQALLLKGALLFTPHVVVTSVPFHLGARVPHQSVEQRA